MSLPSLAHARDFLRRLDAEAEFFTLQTFDDTPAKRKPLARVLHANPMNGAFDALVKSNGNGAGVFVTVAQTDGKGRQEHNITRVRAVFVDLDGAPLAPVLEAGLEPHVVVESSPGRWHAYWLVDDCPLDQFGKVQRALARRFDGDPSVHDLPRVMRVPGFLHRKREPFLSHTLEDVGFNGPPYPLATIVGTLKLDLEATVKFEQLTPVEAADGKIAPGSRHTHLFALGRSMAKKGASPESVRAALFAENSERCNPPLQDNDVRDLAARSFEAKNARDWRDDQPAADAPGANAAHDSGWPEPLDLLALSEQAPQPPHFIIKDWLPANYATLLAGHGGVGKSAIGLLLAVCIAMGLPFFGIATERRRVLYLSCEDRAGLLHWRLTHICAHLGIGIADLAGWLVPLDLVGRDCILWERDPRTGYTVTPAFAWLQERMERADTQLLVVDGVSDTFGGNENARTDVKRFVNALLSLIPDDGALLLLGHVAKPAASGPATSEGYSGSTQWHNAVRARWYLYPETEKDDDDRAQRTGNLLLELQKSNLGGIVPTMTFKWDDDAHMFIATGMTGGGIVDSIRERTEREGILRAILASTEAGVHVPAAMQGPRTAHHVLSARSEMPDSLRPKTATRRFWRHLEQLRAMQLVDEASIRRSDRHLARSFVVTTEGRGQCGQ